MDTFTREDILNDPIFKKLMNKKKAIKTATRNNYLYAFLSFCNYTGKPVTEIHNIHKQEIKDNVPEFEMWLPETLDDYVTYLSDEKNLSYKTIQLYVVNILTLFKKFRLSPIPEIEIDKDYVTEPNKYRLTVEDIQKAIRNSDPPYQTIFIVQAQTGLAIGDTLLLDVEDFIRAVKYSNKSPIYWPIEESYTKLDLEAAIKKVKEDKTIIGCFELFRKKTTNEFYTFIGPEALRSIASLLELRTTELNQKSPLFLKDLAKVPKRKLKKGIDKRLSVTAATSYTKRMHTDRGIFPQIKVDGKPRNYFRTHKIRAWYAGKVRFDAKLSHEDTKYLMGQTTGDVLEKYIDPNAYKNLKENYFQALPHLAIFEPIKVLQLTAEDKAEFEAMKERERIREEERKAEKAEMETMKKRLDKLERDKSKDRKDRI